MSQRAPSTARRRRTAQEAEREILDAAEAFLRERPFRELTVDEVMDATGLSRPSFYVYFRDRHHLALRLIDRIGAEVYERSNRWLGGQGEPRAELPAAIEGAVQVWEEHGKVLRAISDAAAAHEAVERAYRGVVEQFAAAAATQIGRDVEAGRSRVEDPEAVALALCWTIERYLNEALGREPAEDPDRVTRALVAIWNGAIYGAR
jgi:TetR/AcrR family transcriptional regulator, ethionamide resistance regulator